MVNFFLNLGEDGVLAHIQLEHLATKINCIEDNVDRMTSQDVFQVASNLVMQSEDFNTTRNSGGVEKKNLSAKKSPIQATSTQSNESKQIQQKSQKRKITNADDDEKEKKIKRIVKIKDVNIELNIHMVKKYHYLLQQVY